MIKLIALFLVAGCLQLSAHSYAQGISLSLNNATLTTAFHDIQQQTPYRFVYTSEQLAAAIKITISVKNGSLNEVLALCFHDQPLQYSIEDQFIIVKAKERKPEAVVLAGIDVHGRVSNENNEALEGVTVAIKGKGMAASTNRNGLFELKGVELNTILVISSVGYETREIQVKGITDLNIMLKVSTSILDETVIKGYYNTTKRLNTGNVSKIGAEEISKQPVANPLAALEGRMPGIFVTQSSGLPGAGFNVLIRGRNSINSGNDPLYLIDGLPFNNTPLDNISLGYTSQQSPFNSINPEDIESIEVLKDADATAIYGSRGANGVVLITTKKGKAGKTKLDINFYTGSGKVTRSVNYMNTKQYIAMRLEAYKNDNRTPEPTAAYDFLLWDTTRYTDWQKLLIGGTAKELNAQANISGGTAYTQFMLGANLHRETTVFPGDLSDTRGNVHISLHHESLDRKFKLSLSSSYSIDNNNLIRADLYTSLNTLPNTPPPYDSLGHLNWMDKGVYYNNPMAFLLQKYIAKTDNLVSSGVLQYQLLQGLSINVNMGYGDLHVDQTSLRPKASQNPSLNPISSSAFGTNHVKNWIIEPQINFAHSYQKNNFELLVGSNWQNQVIAGTQIFASNYSNDALISSLSGAGTVTVSSNYNQYRYQGFYGRVNYNYDNRYIINLTGRRDGSSRFGPGKQYANFGAAGIAWIFSEYKWIKTKAPFISFGKLRGSFGTSGNDKIGDYQYLDTWTSTANPYAGIAGLQPNSLFNPDYAWEINRKIEAALELGFFHDRIYLNLSYYRNRSSNQLVFYSLPAQAGATGITRNLPALVQNKGWELELQTVNVKAKTFKWKSSFNLTIGRNKLIDYPGLAGSSNANKYVIGKSLTIGKFFDFRGVDPQSGVYTFNGTTFGTDQIIVVDYNPAFYGGLYNELTYKGIQVSFLLQFTKQQGMNFYARNINTSSYPGSKSNQPLTVLDHWQKPGDIKPFQRYISNSSNATAYSGNAYYAQSNAAAGDASYIRLKTISLSYNVSRTFKALKIPGDASIYLSAQNLFTITNYIGFDPENTGNALPPLKVITAGIKLIF